MEVSPLKTHKIFITLACSVALLLLAACQTVEDAAYSATPGDTLLLGQAKIDMQGANLENYTKGGGTTKDVSKTAQIEIVLRNSATGKVLTLYTEGEEGVFITKIEDVLNDVYEVKSITFVEQKANTKITITLRSSSKLTIQPGVVNVAGLIVVTTAGANAVTINVRDNLEALRDYFKTNYPDSAINDMEWTKI